MSEPRAMLFVDGQNLFHGQRSYGDDSFQLDLVKLKENLTQDYELIRAYYFDSFEPDKRGDKEGFYHLLEMNEYRVDAKPLRERDGQFVEKGADIGLATEMIARGFNDSYDTAILVTGDNDFARAVRYVQDQGKRVSVASFESQISSAFQRVADEFIKLDERAQELGR